MTFNHTVTELLTAYEKTTAADKVDYGFLMGNKVYRIILDSMPEWMVVMDRESTSHGGAEKIRLNPTAINKKKLIARGAYCIGTIETLFDKSIKNVGCQYEKYITEKAGQQWKKDSVPYYMDGDLTDKGIKYQIKFERASLVSAETIKKAIAAKG